MAVLFSWTNRASDKLSYESLKLATELPDNELRRTLWVLFLAIFFSFKINKKLIIIATSCFSKVKTSSFMLFS
jgi:hypothetical protein